MTVPAPGQDNPQEHESLFSARAQKVRAAISSAYHLSVEGGMVEHRARNAAEAFDGIVSERVSLLAALEAATRERDAAKASLKTEMLLGEKWRKERLHAERERDESRQAFRIGHETLLLMQARAEAAERALEAARDALRFYANPITYEEMAPLDEWEGSLTGPIPIKDFDHYGDRARSALDASASTQTDTKLCSRLGVSTENETL